MNSDRWRLRQDAAEIKEKNLRPPSTPIASLRASLPILLGCLLVIGWATILRKIGNGNVYAYLGPYALLTITLAEGLRRLDRRGGHSRRAAPNLARGILVGAAVGAFMTLGTYGAYAVASRAFPGLRDQVSVLYEAARQETFAVALAWTVVVLVAEEVLWRGLILEAVERRLGRRIAVGVSLGAYVVVQVGSGSWIVALAALLCGAFWTSERLATGSLVPSLVSHAIWTLTVIHLYPVTGH